MIWSESNESLILCQFAISSSFKLFGAGNGVERLAFDGGNVGLPDETYPRGPIDVIGSALTTAEGVKASSALGDDALGSGYMLQDSPTIDISKVLMELKLSDRRR